MTERFLAQLGTPEHGADFTPDDLLMMTRLGCWPKPIVRRVRRAKLAASEWIEGSPAPSIAGNSYTVTFVDEAFASYFDQVAAASPSELESWNPGPYQLPLTPEADDRLR